MTDNRGTGFRRPKDKSDFMDSLLKARQHGAFETYRDMLIFCGALGLHAGRSVPVEDALSNPVEWSTMINRFGAEELIDMVAVSSTDDTSILDPDRLAERVRIFEAYANGGLEMFQETMSREGLTPAEALPYLVQRQHAEGRELLGDEAPDIRDIGRALGL
jgi:dnd system-associated protein 4